MRAHRGGVPERSSSSPPQRYQPVSGCSLKTLVTVIVATSVLVATGVGATGATEKPHARECSRARAVRIGYPDGLPAFGETARARVERIVATDLAAIQKQYPGVIKLVAELRLGQVWDREPSGEIIIRMPDDDYWIVARLRDRRDCPSAPAFWNGVPLRFVVRPRSS